MSSLLDFIFEIVKSRLSGKSGFRNLLDVELLFVDRKQGREAIEIKTDASECLQGRMGGGSLELITASARR